MIMKKTLKTKKQRAYDKAQVAKLSKEQAIPALQALYQLQTDLRCAGKWSMVNLGTLVELSKYPDHALRNALDEMENEYVIKRGSAYNATNVSYYGEETN